MPLATSADPLETAARQAVRAMKSEDRQVMNAAFDELETETPAWLTKTLQWLRRPTVKWLRIGLAFFFIACSFFWFMPVVGIEFLPIGLLLLAIDVPFLRRPVGRAVLWLIAKWRELRARWKPSA